MMNRSLFLLAAVIGLGVIFQPQKAEARIGRAADYVMVGKPDSPKVTCITIPVYNGVASWNIRTKTGAVWSEFVNLNGGGQACFGSAGVDGIEFMPFNPSGHNIVLPEDILFTVTYASVGVFDGTIKKNMTPSPTAKPAGRRAKTELDSPVKAP